MDMVQMILFVLLRIVGGLPTYIAGPISDFLAPIVAHVGWDAIKCGATILVGGLLILPYVWPKKTDM